VHPGDVRVGEESASVAARNGEYVLGHRKLNILPRRADGGSVCLHELEVAGRAAELRAVVEEVLSTDPERANRLLRDVGGPVSERRVDRAPELIADDDVDDHGCQGDGQRDRGRGHDDEARPEAHSSRSA
jgi:hypothetical protein